MSDNNSIEDMEKEIKKIDESILCAYNGGSSEQVINTLSFYKEQLQQKLDEAKILEKYNKDNDNEQGKNKSG